MKKYETLFLSEIMMAWININIQVTDSPKFSCGNRNYNSGWMRIGVTGGNFDKSSI
jgi:hypothetical protein